MATMKRYLRVISIFIICQFASYSQLNAEEYTVGVTVHDTISPNFQYGTPCMDGSLEFRLDSSLIPYVTGLNFRVEIIEINGLVVSNVIDTIKAGDKIVLPAPNKSGVLKITLPISDDSFTFLITLHGIPQIAGEIYRCNLSYAITEAVCHNNFEIYPEDSILCTIQPSTGLFDRNQKRLVDFVLQHNFPNPFNLLTTIRYYLPSSGYVTLRLYNIAGQELETLVNGYQQAGAYEITWTAKGLPSGIYFYRLQVGDPSINFPRLRSGHKGHGFSEIGKLILQK